jgi:hypothetical protein
MITQDLGVADLLWVGADGVFNSCNSVLDVDVGPLRNRDIRDRVSAERRMLGIYTRKRLSLVCDGRVPRSHSPRLAVAHGPAPAPLTVHQLKPDRFLRAPVFGPND